MLWMAKHQVQVQGHYGECSQRSPTGSLFCSEVKIAVVPMLRSLDAAWQMSMIHNTIHVVMLEDATLTESGASILNFY